MANTSAIPPKKLTARHQQVAALKATGMTNTEIATALGYSQAWVSSLLADGRIADLVIAYQQRYVAQQFTDQSQRLANELAPTITKILEHRDSLDATASLRACDMIMARVMPAKTAHTEERTMRIILEKHEINRIEQADKDMEIVNAQVEEQP